MLTFDSLLAQLTSRGKPVASKKLGNNTYGELVGYVPDSYFAVSTVQEWQELPEAERGIAVRLHDTYVVIWTSTGVVRLDTGGWKTVTTKDRINTYLPAGFKIGSVKGEWRLYTGRDGVVDWSSSVPFADGMQLKQLSMLNWYPVEGTFPSPTVEQQLREARTKLRKDIKAYVAKLDQLVPAWSTTLRENGRLETRGDCFYCQGIVTTTDGAQETGTDHLWSHLREGYIPVSLLVTAYATKGWARPDGAVVQHIGIGFVDQLKKVLAAHLLKVLGSSSEPSAADSDRVRLERFVGHAVEVLEKPGDFGYFGSDETLWSTAAPTWTKHRDSENHDVANFEVVWNTLAAEFPELVAPDLDEDRHPARDFNPAAPGAIYVFGAGHWAVGHIDQIVVPVKLDGSRPVDVDNLHPAFIRVCELREQVEAYPVLEGAEEHVARLEAEQARSEARQYLEEPTEEQVEQLVAHLTAEHGGYPEYLEPAEWLAALDALGLPAASWLGRYRATAE